MPNIFQQIQRVNREQYRQLQRWTQPRGPVGRRLGIAFNVLCLVGFFIIVMGASGYGSLVDHPSTRLTLGTVAVGAGCILVGLALLGVGSHWKRREILESFPRCVGRAVKREVLNDGESWSVWVRCAYDASGEAREENVMVSNPGWWSATGAKEYLDARIAPDGTCQLAVNAEQPDEVYLLPFQTTQESRRILWVLAVIIGTALVMGLAGSCGGPWHSSMD